MLRKTIQYLLLLLFLFLIYLTHYPFREVFPVDAFLRLDPLLGIATSIAHRTLIGGLWLGAILLILTLLLGRFFCGYICPFGTFLDLSDRYLIGKKRRKAANEKPLGRTWKYYILSAILAAAVLGHSLAYLMDPISLFTRFSTYDLWPLAVYAINLLLDAFRPVAEALGWMGLARTELNQPLFSGTGFAIFLIVAVIAALGLIQTRFWCRSLCPLGALLGLFARRPVFRRKVLDTCDFDGRCRRECPTGAIASDERNYSPSECIACQQCVPVCHLNAVSFKPLTGGSQTIPVELGRRKLLGSLAAGLVAGFFLEISPFRRIRADAALRPPGALPEPRFLETCVRCGQCVKACLTNTLQPSVLENGLSSLWTPKLVNRIGPCDQNCNLCGQVCPTGAIRDLDLEEKRYAKIGNAVILKERCVVWEQDRICLICDEACPYNAIYFKTVDGFRRPFVNENKCNGCGQCETACPVTGRSAIVIIPNGEIRLSEGSYIEEAARRDLILHPAGPEAYEDSL